MIKQLLYKTFGLRDGEIAISFLMQLYIFIVITVLLIVKPTVNALFLNTLGADNLPYAYLMVAAVAVITTVLYNKALKNNSLYKITNYALVIFSVFFIALSVILYYKALNQFVLYFYYLFVAMFAVIATSQFWTFANMVFNAREAKRLFGFIGAGAIAGGVFGGYLTSLIVSSFGNKTVILVAGLLMLVNIPILQKIYHLRLRKLNIYSRRNQNFSEQKVNDSTLFIILKSKHLTYLALITGISVLVAKLVDFQFSDFANRNFRNPDDLASFFGFWFSTFNVIALLIQLLLTNRILTKLGVSTTLLILPLGIALGGLLFLTFPELWVLVIIKGLDGSFKQSINKAAFELSIMPIPIGIKNQAKSFIDVAVDSVATGFAGFLLVFLIKKLDLPTSYITIIILFFVLIWIVLIFRLREAYYNSFRENIKRNLVKKNTSSFGLKHETTIVTAKAILNNGEEEEILNLLDRLNNFKIKTLKPYIIGLLQHESVTVKIAAINQLYTYDKGTAIKDVEALLSIKNDELVYEALEYLLHHTYKSDSSIFNSYLNHSNDFLSNATLLCLAKVAKNNYSLAKRYNLEKRIAQKVDELSTPDGFSRKESVAILLNTIAHSGYKKFHSFIAVHLNNKDEYIVNYAIQAAGLSKDEQFIDKLLQFLKEKPFKKATIKALKNYGYKIVETLLESNTLENLDDDAKKSIPKLIQSFKTQDSVNLLQKLLKHKDIIVRYKAIIALSKLKEKSRDLYISNRLIKSALFRECKFYKNTLIINKSIEQQIESPEDKHAITLDAKTEISIARTSIYDILIEQEQISLKNIFKLLSILYNKSDIEMSYEGLFSDIKEAKINALEFLDNLLQSQLKTNVFPLIEHLVISDESHKTTLQLHQISEKNYLNLIVKNRGKRLKLEVINLIYYLNNKNYASIIKPLLKHKNRDVKYLAFKTLNSLTGLRSAS